MKNVKTIFFVVMAVVIIIVAIQNMESVDTKLLFVTVTMPRAVLLLVSLLIGFAVGVVFETRLSSSAKKKKEGAA